MAKKCKFPLRPPQQPRHIIISTSDFFIPHRAKGQLGAIAKKCNSPHPVAKKTSSQEHLASRYQDTTTSTGPAGRYSKELQNTTINHLNILVTKSTRYPTSSITSGKEPAGRHNKECTRPPLTAPFLSCHQPSTSRLDLPPRS